MTISYDTFFQLRREYNSSVIVNELNSHYILKTIVADAVEIEIEVVKGSPEETDFLATKIANCNKRIIPSVLSLMTHDFSNSAKWTVKSFDVTSTTSLFTWKPSAGKKIVLQEIQTSSWKDIIFGSGQHVVFTIWESIAEPCPAYDPLTPTAYNDSPYWVTVWPEQIYAGPQGDNQEVKIYVCFNAQQVPLYKVTEFTYKTAFDFTKKARKTSYHTHKKDDPVLGDIIEQVSWYAYADQGVHIELKDSMNERVECRISNDVPLDNFTSNISSTATAVFKSYDEW